MKKISLLLSATIVSASLFAQKPVFAIKAGLNVADLSEQNVNNKYDTRLGFHVGGLAHIHLSHKVAFQPEVQYSTQGAEVKGSNDEIQLSYINIPLQFQYMFNNGFRLEAGPQLGFLLNAEQEVGTNEVEVDNQYIRIDVALGVGLNYLTYSGIGVGARYNLGLNNIRETGTNDVMNRGLQLSVFYMFDNDHKRKSR